MDKSPVINMGYCEEQNKFIGYAAMYVYVCMLLLLFFVFCLFGLGLGGFVCVFSKLLSVINAKLRILSGEWKLIDWEKEVCVICKA